MKLADKRELDLSDINNSIRIIRRGLFSYAAVQRNGTIIAQGHNLKRYYQENGRGRPGRLMHKFTHYNESNDNMIPSVTCVSLQFKNPKTHEYETVCTWE